MKARLFVTACLVMLSLSAWARPLYLTCKPVSVTQFSLADVYASPPANGKEKYLRDLMTLGLLGWAVSPPETWIVDATDKTVESPDHTEQFSFTDAEISQGKIYVATPMESFDLNRINGLLKYTKHLGKKSIEEWRHAHGGSLPATTEWTYSCTSSTRPAV